MLPSMYYTETGGYFQYNKRFMILILNGLDGFLSLQLQVNFRTDSLFQNNENYKVYPDIWGKKEVENSLIKIESFAYYPREIKCFFSFFSL